MRTAGAWLGSLGLVACAETAPRCPDLAERDRYRIEYNKISDACVARQDDLPTSWESTLESTATLVGWIETRYESKQDGCKLQFSSERFDSTAQEVLVLEGDHLVGDETSFRGVVSLEWSQVDSHEWRQSRATATRTPLCSATAEASFIRKGPVAISPSLGTFGSAAETALAGRGD